MPKAKKSRVKPGRPTYKISEYEKQRMSRIEENQARVNAMGSHQVAPMALRRRQSRHASVSTHPSSSMDEAQSQAQPAQAQHVQIPHQPIFSSPFKASSVASSSTSKRVRGQTRGKRTAKRVARFGKLPVEVPDDCDAPVGLNAPSFASELGKEIRAAAPLKGASSWTKIDPSIRTEIIQRVLDKFDIKGYADDARVQKSIAKRCMITYRDWRCRLHRQYEQLLKNGVDPKSKPPKGVKHDDWNYMIDKVWTNEDFKARSQKAKASRAQLPYNHTCGSRSFATTMSIMAADNNGQKPHIVDFYKESHWSKKKKNWVHEICKEKHDTFVELRDRCSQPDADVVPMSQEEMSIEVLGWRPGYLKGFGIGPKPSSSSKSHDHSWAQAKEVISLKEDLASLKSLNDIQQRQIEDQNKKIEEFQAFQTFAMEALRRAGFVPEN